jgi:hypothetical protein
MAGRLFQTRATRDPDKVGYANQSIPSPWCPGAEQPNQTRSPGAYVQGLEKHAHRFSKPWKPPGGGPGAALLWLDGVRGLKHYHRKFL